jgi:hypothetical protein
MNGQYVPTPAFQLGRFKKQLHTDMNDPFVRALLAQLATGPVPASLGQYMERLRQAQGMTQEAFQVARFGYNVHSDFNEAVAGDLLDVLNKAENLSSPLYTFRQKLDQRLHDGFEKRQIA